MNAKHSAISNSHVTPPELVESVREVLGHIDLDPCSTHLANARVVKSRVFYTESVNGFAQNWAGTAFFNPPGGWMDPKGIPAPFVLDEKTGKFRQKKRAGDVYSPRAWFERLVKWHQRGNVKSWCFLAFSLEQLCTLQCIQEPYPGVGAFTWVVLRERVKFLTEQDGQLVPGTSPTHHNALVFSNDVNLRTLRRVFEKTGKGVVRRPV
jgi:hypothetical protein